MIISKDVKKTIVKISLLFLNIIVIKFYYTVLIRTVRIKVKKISLA